MDGEVGMGWGGVRGGEGGEGVAPLGRGGAFLL